MATEVWPLIRRWRRTRSEHGGRQYRFYESENAVLLCGGIGYEPGKRAAEAVVAHARPEVLIAAGLAGGLRAQWTLGRTMIARTVVDEATGRRFTTESGEGTVVSSREIASLEKKRALAQRFDADLVDMEGAVVAEVAQAHGLPFMAVKAVSDDFDSELPPLQGFVDREGRFQSGRFLLHAAVHPRWWPMIARLKYRTDRAAEALAAVLTDLIRQHAGSEQREMIRR